MVSLIALLVLGQDAEVELYRQFTPGASSSFQVRSHLLSEVKVYPMAYFLPSEVNVDYDFSVNHATAKAEGFSTVSYKRPAMKITEGETADHPPRATTEKVDWNFVFTLSPINEVTDIKESKAARQASLAAVPLSGVFGGQEPPGFERMFREIQMLAIFGGNLESALDLNPKLPIEPVKPGDTWHKTVGFQPRELKGTGRQAVQRLDYEYTYNGLETVNGKRIHRVTAKLDLDTDALPWMLQSSGMGREDSDLKALKLRLAATIVFDLDEKTKETLTADARSSGGVVFDFESIEGESDIEIRLTGKSTMRRVSVK
ncbi:MAG: hypothetical protein KIT11_09175 [Fimbriimonadaceae bacterium]|nr:hypothetical protein [Fimbriimonadaceae bacterium]QYK55499.1 MAG: hypothetical protein KF733_10845 [Fimbriimonadaceae bacterium]